MDENSEERENVLISCPGCGQSMILKDDTTGCLTCPNEHTYTLETLLLGQTLRVETLLHAAVQFLHQQESIVRGMAQQMLESHSVDAFRLEGQADHIAETISRLHGILKSKERAGDPNSASRRFSAN